MTESVSASTTQKLLPISYCIDLLKRAEHNLKLLKTHPADATLIGLSAEQVGGLEVVMARVDRKQKDWIEHDLLAAAEAEASATRSALARLHPIILKARNDALSAEELLTTLNAEPNQKIARERFLSQRTEALTLRDEKEILAPACTSVLPKSYRAADAYQLMVRVTSIDITSSAICFVLVDDVLPQGLFTAADSGFRAVSAQSNDTADLRRLSLCMAYGVEVLLELSLSVNIGGAGLAYSAAIIRMVEPAVARAAIKAAMHGEASSLFED